MLPPDVYSLPHKALRAALAGAGTALGAAEAEGFTAVAGLVIGELDELAAHAGNEAAFIQPVIDRFLPDLAAEVAAEHAALHGRIDAVRRQLDTAATEPTARVTTYRSFQRLVAHDLVHLDHE